MIPFQLESEFKPTGDQPQAIDFLVKGLESNQKHQTLLGATGTGKTFTMANIIQATQKPTLILCHNKTLAAQLASEFRSFFPHNAVCYFVSYYDYYQPESYMAKTDTYIEKDSSINEEIDKYRHSSTMNLLTRRDVIIISSVSCIYGLGSVEDYDYMKVHLKVGESYKRDKLLHKISDIQYNRNDIDFKRSTYRVQGDIIDIYPSYSDHSFRLEFFGDELEKISEIDPFTATIIDSHKEFNIYPAKHTVTPKERLKSAASHIEAEMEERVTFFSKQGRVIEAQRIRERTMFDLEMMMETGYCSGIENYTRYLTGREPGKPPATLLEYFPDDFLLFVDESHISIPQIGGMGGGNRSRKDNLINYGFRLPSAYDNRPLDFPEFESFINKAIYVSATPKQYEIDKSDSRVVEQIIRPTGLLDPVVEVRKEEGQMEDLFGEIHATIAKNQRILITTLTKKMAEQLTDFLQEAGLKVRYLHSDIDTIERVDILRDLRLGVIDVLVGINLLREGLDLPEVSLIAILDANKQGFLRSKDALIQTIGRAARNSEGRVIMYANTNSPAMDGAIEETARRRAIQIEYNTKHGITPKTIIKEIKELEFAKDAKKKNKADIEFETKSKSRDDLRKEIDDLEVLMMKAVEEMKFEDAAEVRDRMEELERIILEK